MLFERHEFAGRQIEGEEGLIGIASSLSRKYKMVLLGLFQHLDEIALRGVAEFGRSFVQRLGVLSLRVQT